MEQAGALEARCKLSGDAVGLGIAGQSSVSRCQLYVSWSSPRSWIAVSCPRGTARGHFFPAIGLLKLFSLWAPNPDVDFIVVFLIHQTEQIINKA